MTHERTKAMQSDATLPKNDTQPVEPSLAQVLDLLGTSDHYDLAWFFDSKTPAREDD